MTPQSLSHCWSGLCASPPWRTAVFGLADPASALAMRCLRADSAKTKAKDKTKARAEAAMAVLAPPLAGALQGRCPDCGAEITAWFEARAYCLRELSLHARYV